MSPPGTIDREQPGGATSRAAGTDRASDTVETAASGTAQNPVVAQQPAQRRAAASLPGRLGSRILLLTGATAFRQASVYVAIVMVAGAMILWVLFERTNELVSRHVVEAMTLEADYIAEIARTAGRAGAIATVTRRAARHSPPDVDARRRSGSTHLYLLETATGEKLAGNLARWPDELARTVSGGTFGYGSEVSARRGRIAAGVVSTIPGQMRLLVARDLEPQRRLAYDTRWTFIAGFGALALIGLVAGVLASRMALSRLSEMTRTSDAIMTGDLTGRIPISGRDDELDHLARNLNAMLDRIEQLMAGLREVSDNIAHDLKTPLTRLRARAEAALRDADGPEHYKDSLGRVIEDADELIKTFNALLLIARLEAGALDEAKDLFDLAELVQDVVELYSPVAEESDLGLTCSAEAAGIMVSGNRQLVGQAIANLIDNSIKYGKAPGHAKASNGGEISVLVRMSGGEAHVVVADRGPGIGAADRERVLRRFVRLEASRTRPGTGLGLSLVAAVARLHGGRVTLEDNAPGLRITLALPLRT